MSPSRDSAPARSKTVCMNLFGSWTFQTMNPEATTAFLPSVRNSRGGGTRTNRRRSNRRTVWTGAGSLNLSPGVLSTRTGLPNWVTTAYSPPSTVKTHSDASPTRTAPRVRRARSLTPRVRPRAASIPPRSEGDESGRYYRSPSRIKSPLGRATASREPDDDEAALLKVVVDRLSLPPVRVGGREDRGGRRGGAPVAHDLDVRYPGKHPLQIFEEGRPIPGDDYNEARHGPSPSGRCTCRGHGGFFLDARTGSAAGFPRTSAPPPPRGGV